MKKINLTIILFCTCITTFSQLSKTKFEVKGNVGYLSDAHMAISFSDNIFSDNVTKIYSSGIYSIDILRKIGNSNFMAEVSYGYEQIKAKHKSDPKFLDVYYINNYLAGFQYNYYKHKKYYAYSSVQFGMRTNVQTDFSERPKNRFNYDVTFVGVRYGKKLGWFWESGFGAKGFVRAGISYKF